MLEALLDRLGTNGTLLMPLFNFGFCDGEGFDVNSTPSRMGTLTETARISGMGVRTQHPIYSFQAIGKHAELFGATRNRSGYGMDSPFALLWDLDGCIGVLDLPEQHSMTYYHHVEERLFVPWRYHKTFVGPYTDATGTTREEAYSLFVRNIEQGVRTHVDPMGEALWAAGVWKGDRPGEGTGLRIGKVHDIDSMASSVIEQGQAENMLWKREINHGKAV